MKSFTLADLKKSKVADLNKDLIKSLEGNKKTIAEPTGLKYIKQWLASQGIDYVTEWQFAKPRKWRFDVAILPFKVAIEYEGLVANGKGGHQTKRGFTANTEKYNKAAEMGWTLYRYTALNYKDIEKLKL